MGGTSVTFIIEDGTIVTNANSYVTLAEIKAYATARNITLGTDPVIESQSVLAVDYLESKRTQYQGSKVSELQELQFPRYNVKIDGFEEYIGQGIIIYQGKNILKMGSRKFIGEEAITEDASKVYVSLNKEMLGEYMLVYDYRKGIENCLKELSNEYELHLLSGDNDFDIEFLKKMFPPNSILKFNQSPDDKLDFIVNLRQRKKKKVMMIGDGINDAGALLESYVGIAVADNAYRFTPACDAILEADKLKHLPFIFELSKFSILTVKISFVISAIYNIIGLYFAATAQLKPVIAAILMPASSITIITFATIAIAVKAKLLKKKMNIS